MGNLSDISLWEDGTEDFDSSLVDWYNEAVMEVLWARFVEMQKKGVFAVYPEASNGFFSLLKSAEDLKTYLSTPTAGGERGGMPKGDTMEGGAFEPGEADEHSLEKAIEDPSTPPYMKASMVLRLTNAAHKLDTMGLIKEADMLDKMCLL